MVVLQILKRLSKRRFTMDEISIWDLFKDLGFISSFLLIGIALRAKMPLVQKLFIPASIIAETLGLLLGPNGFKIILFFDFIANCTTVLISFIFDYIHIFF